MTLCDRQKLSAQPAFFHLISARLPINFYRYRRTRYDVYGQEKCADESERQAM